MRKIPFTKNKNKNSKFFSSILVTIYSVYLQLTDCLNKLASKLASDINHLSCQS